MDSKYDELQKLADLRAQGVLTEEEFDWQKTKLLYEEKGKEIAGPDVSEKSRLVAFLLCTFAGPFGVHRFYVGKITSGIMQILFGWATLFIWPLVDWIMIISGSFRDKDGKTIKSWKVE